MSLTRIGPANVRPATLKHGTLCPSRRTQETEDLMGLDKRKRRDVQRRLTGLGFDTKVNGRFDEATRAVITRWQSAHGYPKTGFLNTPQHEALLTESVAGAHASLRSSGKSDDDRPGRRRGGEYAYDGDCLVLRGGLSTHKHVFKSELKSG
jgi:peptidoglycan hydrolase-like protein with peptidoglycan-binding domain